MGIIVAVICFIIGIPFFLFGALIFTGLSIAGIIGSPVMIPAIILGSALLLVGAFLMFMGSRIIQEKKVMTENVNGQSPSNVKTSATKRHVSLGFIFKCTPQLSCVINELRINAEDKISIFGWITDDVFMYKFFFHIRFQIAMLASVSWFSFS